ncbi:MAG: type IV secretion protein IcmC [Legionellaceae bacterium]|nr:type IV secretion protein IcmC [Legionellaceae bacterium]
MSATCDIINHANMLANLANNLGSVQTLIKVVAYVMGFAFGIKGIMSLRHLSESRGGGQQSGKEVVAYFIAAAALVSLPTTISIVLQSSFGSSNILAYSPINSSNAAFSALFGSGSTVGRSLVMIIQTIGYVAFVRGFVLLTKSGSGQGGQQSGGIGKGLTHILGGILAINIVGTLQIINNTLYGT